MTPERQMELARKFNAAVDAPLAAARAAYKSDKKRTVLYALRQQMGFSMREMAAELEIHPATYQCYEEGTRKTPPHVIAQARASAEKVETFMAGIAERVDKFEAMQRLNRGLHEIMFGETVE